VRLSAGLSFDLGHDANGHLHFDTLRASDRNVQDLDEAKDGDPQVVHHPFPVSVSARVQSRS
jgi:hypothetical protein